jgi:hypothetical protein
MPATSLDLGDEEPPGEVDRRPAGPCLGPSGTIRLTERHDIEEDADRAYAVGKLTGMLDLHIVGCVEVPRQCEGDRKRF